MDQQTWDWLVRLYLYILQDGQKFIGTITEQGNGLFVETDEGMIKHILWKDVKYYRYEYTLSKNGNVIRARQPRSQAFISKISNEIATKEAANIEPAAATAPDTKPKSDQNLPFGYQWSGRIEAGASLQTGNSEKESVDVDGTIKARGEKDRMTLGGEYNRAKDEGDVTVDNKSAYINYDYFIGKKWFLGGRLKGETDDIDDLDLRTRLGGFAGHQFYEKEDLNLQVRLGLDYIHEEFEDDSEEDDLAYAWAFDYDQKVWQKRLQVFHKHDLSVPADDAEGFLFDSESGLRVPLMETLIGTAQVDFDWDNDPLIGIQEDDTKYSLKLGYEW